jgi:hypothetical protein
MTATGGGVTPARRAYDLHPTEDPMTLAGQHPLSRRGFCLCCTSASVIAATGGWLTPR